MLSNLHRILDMQHVWVGGFLSQPTTPVSFPSPLLFPCSLPPPSHTPSTQPPFHLLPPAKYPQRAGYVGWGWARLTLSHNIVLQYNQLDIYLSACFSAVTTAVFSIFWRDICLPDFLCGHTTVCSVRIPSVPPLQQ
jgi:hypothetical protein